ncbi:MAG: Cys-tRNA(Pro) deacylase [Clostridiales bacterium]|nr:Cys-tRNA(Pro) deacylase [Clostridiales bacterium]MBR6209740.1 Cys-tRNA(Pro) deacylase [Clostridiales bacterium]
MAGFKKTNAMRILDKAGVDYTYQEYEYDENDLDGHHVAEYLNIPYEEVFKTLVAKSETGEYLVFCICVDDEIDLKKAAKLAGAKRVEMIHVKDLLGVTGYIRGGCSPIGMKKKYRTFFDEMIELVDDVCVSGGQRGLQLRLKPADLIAFTEAQVGDFAMRG